MARVKYITCKKISEIAYDEAHAIWIKHDLRIGEMRALANEIKYIMDQMLNKQIEEG